MSTSLETAVVRWVYQAGKPGMKVGDLVKADPWVEHGKIGMILSVQEDGGYGYGAYVLINHKIKLIRIENLNDIDK